MSVSSDRWTCPNCPPGRGTLVVVGSPEDIRACIRTAQLRHAEAHRAATALIAKLGLPDTPRARNRKAS